MLKSAIQKRTPLPSKEATLFKELLTLYETKQLKKGLKTAEQILKKFPDHGETLCMKGLVLTHMGKREEGLDLVKKGIKLDLMSHICWHVFGLIQKGDRNYEEALKSYTQALKFDKDNLNLLRDSAQLQTHLRLFENLVETRHAILRIRPNHRQNWIALAVAHHLNGNLDETRTILDHYIRSLKNVPGHDIEHSETLLYYIHVLEELGKFQEACSSLDQNAKSGSIVDRLAVLETRARLLSKLNSPEAAEAWCALIKHKTDSYDAYLGYLSTEGVSVEVPNPEAVEKLEKFVVQIPSATAPRRLQLTLATAEQFRELVKAYIIRGLEKGVPSLFADLKALYVDKEKAETIEDIVDSLREENAPTTDTTSPRNKQLEPTTYLWTLYFLAQHYSYCSHHNKALNLLDLALEHTPTLPELHLLKGRVLKRVGDYIGAAKCTNAARLLDGQDRFLNTKCGKYLLRAGMVDEAMTIFGMFTKKDAATPAADLQDMQSLLFLLEEADAQRKNGKLNMALKKYTAIKAVFDDFENDQFDFHGYNLRKFTINIYLELLKWEDRLRTHPVYVKAIIEASKIFVQVSDDPSIVTSLSSASSQLTDAEKKARKKAKKAEKKREEEKKAPPQANADKDLDNPPKKDDDPDGFKFLGCSDPLEQASKILQPLTTLTSKSIDVWIASYDVAVRRNKLLQAVAALNRVLAINPKHPELHVRIVDLKLRASALPQQQPTPIGPVFSESVAKIVPDSISLETFNSQYLQRHNSDAEALLAVARVSQMLNEPCEEIERTIFSILDDGVEVDVKTAIAAVGILASVKTSTCRVDEFKAACRIKFPLATVFNGPEEIADLKRKVLSDSIYDVEEEEHS